MSHRVLFFLSILIIVVGIGGIIYQKKQPTIVPAPTIKEETVRFKTIIVAESLRDLHQYDILRSADYRMRTERVPTLVKNPCDLSSLSRQDITGAIMRSNILHDSCIPPETFLLPDDPDFAGASLRSDEMPYSFTIKYKNDYLLSSIHSGDKVSLYIRTVEVEKGKNTSTLLDSSGGDSLITKNSKYVTTRLFNNLTVLNSRRFASKDADEKQAKSSYSYSNMGEVKGEVILRLNKSELATIITVENAGELFILPEGDSEHSNIEKIRMDEILPQFKSIKELRGRK